MQDDRLDLEKAALRQRAAAARAMAFAALGRDAAQTHLTAVLAAYPGAVIAAYIPMGSEISPLEAVVSHGGPVCMPVVTGPGQPLRFRAWAPNAQLMPGGFGTRIPAAGDWLVPDLLIVPLLAFDQRGFRLGYGGGFYDRTLVAIRARAGCRAIGLAFAAQEVAQVPTGPHDAPLDLIVTEEGTIFP